jgi:hypothetical protein
MAFFFFGGGGIHLVPCQYQHETQKEEKKNGQQKYPAFSKIMDLRYLKHTLHRTNEKSGGILTKFQRYKTCLNTLIKIQKNVLICSKGSTHQKYSYDQKQM